MKHLTLLALLIPGLLAGQNVIEPWWGSILADGTMSPGEWDDAPTVPVPLGTGNTAHVAVAVDAWGIFLGFLGNLESDQRFPEVLLDADHDAGAAWNTDDHWFHVSATNCHHQGEYGIYDDCSTFPPDWSAHPGFTPSPPLTDSVEVAIPWWYLGLSPLPGDTVGIAFVLTNTVNVWDGWPAGSDRMAPDTWGDLVIPGATGIADGNLQRSLALWPNPASDRITVQLPGEGFVEWQVRDAAGRIVRIGRTASVLHEIPLDGLETGQYVLQVMGEVQAVQRFSIVR